MVLEDQLLSPPYRNWVRSGLALKYLKEGLQNVVDDEVKSLQTSFLNDIGLPTVLCGQCTTENVLPCPSRGICSKRERHCTYHDKRDPTKTHSACPKGICNIIYHKIITQHRYGSPCWKNTDASKWCTDHWEIAKCFIPEVGYKDKVAASDTDCSGILNVVLNGLFMQNAFDTRINPPADIISKNRQARNAIMHSCTLEVTDAQLGDYIDDMVSLLSDKNRLLNHPDAVNARTTLIQLKSNTLNITTRDEYDIRREALNAVNEKKQEALQIIDTRLLDSMDTISRKQDDVTHFIDDTKTEARDALVTLCDEQNQQLQNIRDTFATDIGKRIADSEKRMEDVLQNRLDKRLDEFCQEKLNALQEQFIEMRQEWQVEVTRLRFEMQTLNDKHDDRVEQLKCYLQRKDKLQESICKMYARHLSTVPVSPLLSEVIADVNTVYGELVMRDDLINDTDKRDMAKSTQTPETQVKSYKDIFNKHDEGGTSIPCTRIFVLGDAGMGKTTWSLKLVNTWLSSQDKMNKDLDLDDEDEKLITKYEFMFFISLRHAKNERNISDMIRKQLFIDDSELMDITHEVMEHDSDKCLIILDGLDEWSSQDHDTSIDETGLPGQNERCKYTIVTTTRPWKLESISLKEREIDRAVEIKGLARDSITNLATHIVESLNQKTGENKSSKECLDNLKTTSDTIMNVPLLLTSLVCLWYENDSIDRSLVKVYSGLVEILIKYAEGNTRKINKKCKLVNRLADIPTLNDTKTKWSLDIRTLPDCLSTRRLCKTYGPLLLTLGKLAFNALFSDDKESCLVFTEESIEEFLNEEELEIALKIDILSQSKLVGNILSRKFSISFLHKTMQEFFAAVYMVSGGDTNKTKHLGIYTAYCKTIENVFEMEHLVLFVCGLCPSMASAISEHISTLSDDIKTTIFGRALYDIEFSLTPSGMSRRLHQYLLNCDEQKCLVSDSESHIYIKHHVLNFGNKLIHSRYTEENSKTMTYLQKHGKHMRFSLTSSYTETTENNVDTLCKCLKEVHNLNELTIAIAYPYMSILSHRPDRCFSISTFRTFQCALQSIQHITCLHLQGLLVKDTDMSSWLLLDMSKPTTLKTLKYKDSNIPVRVSASHIEDIVMKTVSVSVLQEMLQTVKHSPSLKSMKISTCKSKEYQDLNIDLRHAKSLQCIDIRELNGSSLYINTTCIQEVKLVSLRNKLPDFFTSLRHCRRLTTLHCESLCCEGNLDLSESLELKCLWLDDVSVNNITLPKNCIRELKLHVFVGVSMIHNMQHQSQLEELDICIVHEGNLDLSDFTKLKTLKHHCSDIITDTPPRVTLPSLGCLREVELEICMLNTNDSTIGDLLSDLQYQDQLEKLTIDNIHYIMSEANIKLMIRSLSKLRMLKVLSLRSVDFANQCLVLSGSMQQLERVELDECKLTPVNWRIFVQSLQQLKQRLRVKITYRIGKLDTGTLNFVRNYSHVSLKKYDISNIIFQHIEFDTC